MALLRGILRLLFAVLWPLPTDRRGWRWFWGIFGLMAAIVAAVVLQGVLGLM